MSLIWSSKFQIWEPAELGSSLALWLDAADASTITLNGSTVSQWWDKSGNGNHVSQATAAFQPDYTLSAINGKPAVDYQAETDTLTIVTPKSSFNFMHEPAGSGVFLVGNFTAIPTGSRPYLSTRETTTGYLLRYRDFDRTNAVLSTNNVIHLNSSTLNYATPSATTLIVGHEHALSLSADSQIYLNAETVRQLDYTSTPSSGFNADNPLRLGGTICRLGEIVIVSQILLLSDRQRLEGYLAWKWGLVANLPANHPFRFTPPLPGV